MDASSSRRHRPSSAPDATVKSKKRIQWPSDGHPGRPQAQGELEFEDVGLLSRMLDAMICKMALMLPEADDPPTLRSVVRTSSGACSEHTVEPENCGGGRHWRRVVVFVSRPAELRSSNASRALHWIGGGPKRPLIVAQGHCPTPTRGAMYIAIGAIRVRESRLGNSIGASRRTQGTQCR